MPEISLSDAAFDELDERGIAAYREAVHASRYAPEHIAQTLAIPLEDADAIGQRLVHLCLLRPMPGAPDVLVPVSPDAAAANLVGPAEEQIRELQHSVSRTRDGLLSLLPAYFESRRQRNPMESFDIISDYLVVEALLKDCGDRCRTEVLTVQPGGPRPNHLLESARSITGERLARGIRVQHIYQHTVRGDLANTAYIRDVTALGAEVRTTDQLIDRMIIYDREIVFLPEQGVEGRPPGAIVVREPTLVAFLCKLYDHLWLQATPFEPDAEEHTDISDDVKWAIVKLMAQGYKDEMVARRLGMSVRTCRRHISEIMEELDATSRFQAGVNAVLSGLFPGSAPAPPP